MVFLLQGALGLLMGLGTGSRPQPETLYLFLTWLLIAMIPLGCLWAWSAWRLHQFHNNPPGVTRKAIPLRHGSGCQVRTKAAAYGEVTLD